MMKLLSLYTIVFISFFGSASHADEMPPAPYVSPMRDQCEAERVKDAEWTAQVKDSLRKVVHEEEASAMVNNNRHVVLSYAVVWLLLVAFVILQWTRQRSLAAQIAVLRSKIEAETRK